MTSVPEAEPESRSRALRQPPPILQPGRTCWVTSWASDSGLLVDGEDYFAAFHRAASAARDSILLAGWQFDTTVSLLRGKAIGADGDVRLLPFLRSLCEANRSLQIRVLCWDHGPAYLFQREWFQSLRFNLATRGQIVFLSDDRVAVGGSHHQKFAVIDGSLAFVGSMDLCHARWDRRQHPVHCEERCEPHGEDLSGPYHEVQAWLTGPVVGDLQELFLARWQSAGGQPFELQPPRPVTAPVRSSIEIGGAQVGLSRTMGRTLVPDQPSIREILQLHVDAIAAARRSIYIESQYFGARAVTAALVERLQQPTTPPLDLVIVCPREMHTLTERVAMQEAQDEMFRRVREAGARSGHRVGIYHVVSCERDEVAQTYIHSKVMGVDDRFLTVGSANLNNRSLGLDSELNVSWEAEPGPGHSALRNAIRRVRVALLAEHAGLEGRAMRPLYRSGHVSFLDHLARSQSGRLRIHEVSSATAQRSAASEATFTLLDPAQPLEDYVFERLAPRRRDVVAYGVRAARHKLRSWRRRRRTAVNRPRNVARRPHLLWLLLVHVLRRGAVPVLIFAAVLALLWAAIAWIVELL